jgi:hypothetical protein
MAWLESNQDVWRHYKTLKLSRLLGVESQQRLVICTDFGIGVWILLRTAF